MSALYLSTVVFDFGPRGQYYRNAAIVSDRAAYVSSSAYIQCDYDELAGTVSQLSAFILDVAVVVFSAALICMFLSFALLSK